MASDLSIPPFNPPPQPRPAAPEPTQRAYDDHAYRRLEVENQRLQNTVRSLESALRAAGKVLSPYISRTSRRD